MFILKLILRNAFRHKLRTGLTILGVAIAIIAFGLLRTLVSAWYLGVESASASRLITRNAISLIFTLPISYGEKIRPFPASRRSPMPTGSAESISTRRTFSPISPWIPGPIWTSIPNS